MMNEETKPSKEVDLKALKRKIFLAVSVVFPLLGLMIFLPAWSLNYWEGWIYIFVLAIPMMFFGRYLFKHNPELLERRLRTKEKRKEQKLIIKLSLVFYLFIYILPGFDKRLGWSGVPLAVKIASFVMVMIGYLMTVYVLKVNSYASRVIEIDESQKVITTGPYAMVRHPMYFSLIVFYLFTPLALGSYWAIIPDLLFLLVFIPRILDEEQELLENLEGYREYIQKVKYRLIPGVW